MDYRKVTAIIRKEGLNNVENALRRLGAPGLSISDVKGYGEYANYYSRDLLVDHVRIEVFCCKESAESIAQAIMEVAHIGLEGDGIVAILPAEQLYRIRTRSQIEKGSE